MRYHGSVEYARGPRLVRVESLEQLQESLAPHGMFPSPEAVLEAQALVAGLMDEENIAQLMEVASARERDAIVLFLEHGGSRKAAAQAMGIRRSTFDVLIHRVKQKARSR